VKGFPRDFQIGHTKAADPVFSRGNRSAMVVFSIPLGSQPIEGGGKLARRRLPVEGSDEFSRAIVDAHAEGSLERRG
jgi:hypothetical protein